MITRLFSLFVRPQPRAFSLAQSKAALATYRAQQQAQRYQPTPAERTIAEAVAIAQQGASWLPASTVPPQSSRGVLYGLPPEVRH